MVQNMAQLLSSHIFRTGLRSHKKLQTTILQHPLPVKNLILNRQQYLQPLLNNSKKIASCDISKIRYHYVIQDNLVENL